MPYDKSLARFDPLHARPFDQCERHYLTRHFPWAREWLRPKPSVVSYHIGRAVAELDREGGWSDAPSAWRFVSLRFRPGERPPHSAERAEQIAQDHRNCLRDLRSCSVRERFVVGSDERDPGGRAKYLFEYDRSASTPPHTASARFADLVEAVASGNGGFSMLIADDVLSEGATEPIDEPGQRALDRRLEQTAKVGYLEAYFDDRITGDNWLARPDVRELLIDPYFEVARGYRIEEHCAFDKR